MLYAWITKVVRQLIDDITRRDWRVCNPRHL